MLSATADTTMTDTDTTSADSAPRRIVHQADALAWLAAHPLATGTSILTSLPDVVEFRHRDPARWRPWFVAAATAVLRAVPDRGAAVFYQTDTRREGRWTDKAFLVQLAAHELGVPLLWHKIVCRAPAGRSTGGRPGYAHLLCFSRTLVDATPTPDVLPELGAMTWSRAIGLAAARFALQWLRAAGATAIADPFCGIGTTLAVANGLGLPAIGVELNPGRAARARKLQLWSDQTMRS